MNLKEKQQKVNNKPPILHMLLLLFEESNGHPEYVQLC